MRVIVCGSRKWDDERPMLWTLDGLNERCVRHGEVLTVVHGAAAGADTLAGEVCRLLHVQVEAHPVSSADWQAHGKGAGHIRNRHMLSLGADYVLAFKAEFDWSFQRGGTEHMVSIARDAGIRTYVIQSAL